MFKMRARLLLFLFACVTVSALPGWPQSSEQQPARMLPSRPLPQRRRISSPQVNADRTVTFRFRDPDAGRVLLDLEGVARPLVMQKGDDGVWSATSDPLAPNLYGYSFVADSVGLIGPSNSLIKPNLLGPQSMVLVPGASPEPWEITDIPHGVVHHIFYHSAVVARRQGNSLRQYPDARHAHVDGLAQQPGCFCPAAFPEKRDKVKIGYQLHAYVVMPNHVHVLVTPVSGHTLSSILHSWKSYTANEANKVIGRRGHAFWQRESYDQLVRDEEDFFRIQDYIRNNPVKTGLAKEADAYPYTYSAGL